MTTQVAERTANTLQTERQSAREVASWLRAGTLRPPVDVFEDDEAVTLVADMPGVAKERLNVRVERDSLVIEGDVQIDMPEHMEALHADVRATHYHRRFALGDELESDKIEAVLRDGQLTVRVPKKAQLRRRRIAVL
jgi:HSP20 family protein